MSLVRKITLYISVISLISYITVVIGNKVITKKEIDARVMKEYYDTYKIYKAAVDEYKDMLKNGIFTSDIVLKAKNPDYCKQDNSDVILGKYLSLGIYKYIGDTCDYIGIYAYKPLDYLSKLENISWVVVLHTKVIKKLYNQQSFWDNYVGGKIITKKYIVDSYKDNNALSIFLYSKKSKIISYKVENIGEDYYLIMEIPIINVSGIELGNVYLIKNISWIYKQEHRQFLVLTIYGITFTSILLIIIIFIVSQIIKDINNLLSVALKLKEKDFLHLDEVEKDPILEKDISKLNEISKLKKITYMMAIEIKKLVSELQKDKEKFQDMAYKDALTGIYNRRFFFEEINISIEQAKRANVPICIVMYDIDNFKKVNDTYGHDMGDVVLKDFANVIVSSIRKSDIPARLGGEEFAAYLYNTDIENGFRVANNIRQNFENSTHTLNGTTIKCTCSGGIYQIQQEDGIDSALKKVDEALYVAKRTTKNRVVIYKEGIEDELKNS
ncbi:diguanylate cyclase [Hydrogenobaculum sp. Y04AAS1]|uniref:diguanylate cyclase n=1 Tax=Hydrogenobaculum sp. (strain Y04AAS1) TaxID=380749 RepID=UPI00015BCCB4|nr:diguanylate cyclase [Hydrogenobaculum sp. Y04AAS1]HCT66937.1 GGDEF domain-containing protein [Hydrogenobaculum sp.]